MRAADLATELFAFVDDVLERAQSNYAPGFALPAVFAGDLVGPDTHADLAYTLSFMSQAPGRDAAYREPIGRILTRVDGSATHTFYSYRIAEVVRAAGGLEAFPFSERANLLAAADSTSHMRGLDDGRLPPNFVAVLARCEHARAAIGGDVDEAVLDALIGRLRELLTANVSGFVDDSDGEGRFDIYSPDIYVFAEPLAARLGGDVWRRGLTRVLGAVEQVAARNGAAIPWGRSIGALSVCMTIELAALALGHGLADDAGAARWLARAEHARSALDDWFSPTGLITAHQNRATFAYRGPFRRLQMTFDCLGKLAAAAVHLARCESRASAAGAEALWQPRDALLAFADASPASVWTYRSDRLAFCLPFVGGSGGDYAPTPRNPGTFEVPVDRPLYVGVPTAWVGGKPHVPAGVPAEVAHADASVVARHGGWPEAVAFGARAASEPLAGSRRATYRVERRTLSVTEELEFARVPDAVTLQLAEAAGQPLHVRVESEHPYQELAIDTAGIASWRSFWGELPVVHQVEFEPAVAVRFTWSVTPKVRVATHVPDLEYHRCLYDELHDRVAESAFPTQLARGRNPGALVDALADVDVFHLHWPEWLAPPDVALHRRIADALRDAAVRIVWTQHNRVPHALQGFEEVYALWAGVADGVIHHSEWGREEIRSTYRFQPAAEHRVIPHPHWGPYLSGFDALDRTAAEAELGLAPCGLRLGVVGSPRPGKHVQLVLDAVARARRPDVQLVACVDDTDTVPDDPRIIATPYRREKRSDYNRRLRTLDALILPFAPDRMLTTGTVGDVVGAGLPALVSDWPYLHEALADAAIPYGSSVEDLAACIDALDAATLARAAEASRRLQDAYDPARVAAETFSLLDDLATTKT